MRLELNFQECELLRLALVSYLDEEDRRMRHADPEILAQTILIKALLQKLPERPEDPVGQSQGAFW